MRCVILSFLMAACTQVVSAQSPPDASQVIKTASEKAVRENKNIFLIFHASWCGWCHKLDTSMNDPAIKPFFQNNYVTEHLVVLESANKKQHENPGASELMNKYGGENAGIPYWVILDKNGNKIEDSRERTQTGKIGENVGCPAKKNEVEYFLSVLRKTSSINAAGLQAIRERFLVNSNTY